MEYKKIINHALIPSDRLGLTAVDLFAGCGGLSLGFESVGIKTLGYESKNDAVSTYNRNMLGYCRRVHLDLETIYPKADLLIAGPPCQPYSRAGLQQGVTDMRNGFPIFLDAVDKINPKVCVFENVKGLLSNNGDYLASIKSELKEKQYVISFKVLDSSNYNVPQKRNRLFLVAVKNGAKFEFPDASNTVYSVGDAIGNIRSSTPKGTRLLTKSMDNYINKYELASKCKFPRDLDLSKPSRTLTCRNLSGMTGDMIRLKLNNGTRRTLSVREAALIQSFPTWFRFSGTPSNQLTQLGNAVPPMMSRAVAKQIVLQYFSN